jgi:hypothetical protein
MSFLVFQIVIAATNQPSQHSWPKFGHLGKGFSWMGHMARGRGLKFLLMQEIVLSSGSGEVARAFESVQQVRLFRPPYLHVFVIWLHTGLKLMTRSMTLL